MMIHAGIPIVTTGYPIPNTLCGIFSPKTYGSNSGLYLLNFLTEKLFQLHLNHFIASVAKIFAVYELFSMLPLDFFVISMDPT